MMTAKEKRRRYHAKWRKAHPTYDRTWRTAHPRTRRVPTKPKVLTARDFDRFDMAADLLDQFFVRHEERVRAYLHTVGKARHDEVLAASVDLPQFDADDRDFLRRA